MPEMDSSRHAEFGALLIVSNGCIQLNIRAKTCMRCVHTHINTHSAIQTHMDLHTDVGIERNSCKTVCLTYFAQLSRCVCFWSGLVGIFWKTLVLVAFPRKTKVSQSFPKFPKVSQSFPKFPKRSRVTFSFEFVLRFHAGWGLFGSLGRWVSKGNPKFPPKNPKRVRLSYWLVSGPIRHCLD